MGKGLTPTVNVQSPFIWSQRPCKSIYQSRDIYYTPMLHQAPQDSAEGCKKVKMYLSLQWPCRSLRKKHKQLLNHYMNINEYILQEPFWKCFKRGEMNVSWSRQVITGLWRIYRIPVNEKEGGRQVLRTQSWTCVPPWLGQPCVATKLEDPLSKGVAVGLSYTIKLWERR